MAEKVVRVAAIKRFFERADEIAPDGGRKVEMSELKALTQQDKNDLAPLCAAALGVELADVPTVAS